MRVCRHGKLDCTKGDSWLTGPTLEMVCEHMCIWLIGALLMVAALELSYLLIINLIVNLPITQVLINRVNPYPATVHWRRAWSLHPFRFHLRGITANGQTPSRRWQFYTPAASGTIRIWPLLRRTVGVHTIRVADVVFHGLHQPDPDQSVDNTGHNRSEIVARQPPERQPTADGAANATFAPNGRPWKTELGDVRATGVHRIGMAQTQGVLKGHARADMSALDPWGSFGLSGARFDVTLMAHSVDTDREIIRHGHVAGTLSMPPLRPDQHTRSEVLTSLTLDAHLSCEAGSLAFFNPLLKGFYGMRVDGAGSLAGRVRLEKATLQPDSHLAVSAQQLSVDVLAHRAHGTGTIRIDVDPQTPESSQVSLVFDSLQGLTAASRQPLFIADGLAVSGKGPVAWKAIDACRPMARDLSVILPSVRVPDLGRCQHYLPGHWPVTLHGGQAAIRANVQWSGSRLAASLTLVSENADIGVAGYRFTSNLDLAVHANSSSLFSVGIDLSGTRIAVDNARLSNRDRSDAQPWQALVKVESGAVELHAPETQGKGIGQWVGGLKTRDLVSILTTGAQPLKLTGHLSDLQWLTLLLNTPYRLAVHGAGEMRADLHLASGRLSDGTVLWIHPSQLRVDVLDYSAEGNGRVTLTVTKGAKGPGGSIAVTLEDAFIKRRQETKAFIDQVAIRLRATADSLRLDSPDAPVALHLQIPSARVRDMAVYNRYFPVQSVLRVLGGRADLRADIRMTPESAQGYVKLRTHRLRIGVNDQEIGGELTADVNLAGGAPQQMTFDISGSTLALAHVRVAGRQREFDQADWHARLDLHHGVAVWAQPTRVHIEAGVSMRDTRPLAAIMANQRGKYGWLEKIFNVADVHGFASATITPHRIVIARLLAESDDMDVGAKGVIEARSHDGVIYLRYKKLHGMLKIEAGGRSFHIRQARKKFDTYAPDGGGFALSIKKLSEL